MQVVNMGYIGFSAEPNIGTYGCGPCLGLLAEFENLYVCAHFNTAEQIESFKNMYSTLLGLGYTFKRAIAFRSDSIDNKHLLLSNVLEVEIMCCQQLGFVRGRISKEFNIPQMSKLELDLMATAALSFLYESPGLLRIQFKPDDLQVFSPGPNLSRSRIFYRPPEPWLNISPEVPESSPLDHLPVAPTVDPLKNFIAAARRKKWL